VTEPIPDEVGERARRRNRRNRVILRTFAVLFVIAVWATLAGGVLLRARHDASAGLDSAAAAQSLTSPDDVLQGKALTALQDSRQAFARARGRLRNPLLSPIRILPVAGRQLRAATALSSAAEKVSATGEQLVTEARDALRQPHTTGAERIALLRRVSDVTGAADARLAKLDLGPSHALLSPLAKRRAELVDKLAKVRRTLADGHTVAGGLADLLTGPRTYLVMASNNAEMRSGSGMFLSVGELQVSNGSFALTDFRPSGDLAIPAAKPAPPIADADYAARWGWLNPNREWRNLGASPRFDATAALAAQMWPASGGKPVDGVLALDPVALSAILKATGPVQSGGKEVSADTVVPLLLHDQYAGINTTFDLAQAGRREQLGSLARSTLDAVQGGGWDAGKLATSLADAAKGRHLLAWGATPKEDAVWRSAGISGQLTESSLLVSVLNRGANKLDQFLKVDARLDPSTGKGTTNVTLRLTITNTTPPGEPLYVAGPYPGSMSTGPGDYVGVLSVDLPAAAGNVSMDGGPLAASGPDGPAQVWAVPVHLGAGTSTTVNVRFTMPGDHGRVKVEPSARVPAVSWSAPGASWQSDAGRVVTW
jgi:hypothetical protein